MTSTPFTIVIHGHPVVCESAEQVIALIKAAGGAKTSAPAPVSASTAEPKKTRRRRGPNKATKAAKPTMAAAPAAKPAKAVKAKKAKRAPMKKAAGLSKRSVAFLNEFSRSGGSTLTADRLAKATGAKGPKGVGGSLTALGRELKSFGYDINAIVSRKKTLEDGTTWSANTGASGLVNEILGKVPVVA